MLGFYAKCRESLLAMNSKPQGVLNMFLISFNVLYLNNASEQVSGFGALDGGDRRRRGSVRTMRGKYRGERKKLRCCNSANIAAHVPARGVICLDYEIERSELRACSNYPIYVRKHPGFHSVIWDCLFVCFVNMEIWKSLFIAATDVGSTR